MNLNTYKHIIGRYAYLISYIMRMHEMFNNIPDGR